jgi:osmotically-inducible protein OsmY
MSDDESLRDSVIAELEWQPGIDPTHIGVAVRDGIVTLSGFVESFAAKAAAERAASGVRGVRAIAEEIEVRLPNHQRHADDEIAERALRILAWDVEVPDDRIKVKVEHGVVTLTGDVAYQFQRAAAEAAVRRLGGVRGVLNMVRLVPAFAHSADPDLVKQKIEAALRRSAELEAEGVQITARDGRVTLRGQVKTWWERDLAERAAWAAPGVREVVDELRVEP